ncbi:MAG: 3-deoxy-D-manno-octulosonic acid transferase, partial [Bacteroidia bacterium]
KKNDPTADYIFYLPFDRYNNAKKFISLVEPKMVFWVKYDFWFFYLNQLKKQQIPVFLISALYRNDQLFFKWYGKFYLNMLQSFKHIFCQTQSAASLIQSYGINNVSVSGDTRYDNVIERSKNIKIDLIIEEFCKANSFVIVAGSSYKPEEELLKHVLIKLKGKIKIIVAPHFVSPSRIDEIKTTFNRFNYQVLSQSSSLNSNTDVLIIDSIGKLIGAYKYAKLAFVGGGFNKGNLHNILEPAVFGLPICFGPEIDRFPEACILFDNKLAFKVKDSTTLLTFIESYLNDNNKLAEDKMKIQNFVYDNHGSAQKIIDKLKYDFSLL